MKEKPTELPVRCLHCRARAMILVIQTAEFYMAQCTSCKLVVANETTKEESNG